MPTPGLNLLNQFYGGSGVPNFFQPQGQTPVAQATPGTGVGAPAGSGTQAASGTGTQAGTTTAAAPEANPWGASPWTKGNITRLGNPWGSLSPGMASAHPGLGSRPSERSAITYFTNPWQANTGTPAAYQTDPTAAVHAPILGNFNPYPYLYGNAGGVGIPTSAGSTAGNFQNMFRPTSEGAYVGNYISPSIYRNLAAEFDERNFTGQLAPFLANPVDWMTQHVLPTIQAGDPSAATSPEQLTQEEFTNLLMQAMESIQSFTAPQGTYTQHYPTPPAQSFEWIPQLNQILTRLGIA